MNTHPPNAVLLRMKAKNPEEKWALVDATNQVLCQLPCDRWVAPNSGYRLRMDADQLSEVRWIPLPDDLEYSPGRTVDATARKRRVGWWPWIPMGIGATTVIAAIASGCENRSDGYYNGYDHSYENCDSRDILLGAGGVIMGGTLIAWIITAIATTGYKLDLDLAEQQSAKSITRSRTGLVEFGDRKGTWAAASPLGVTGTF